MAPRCKLSSVLSAFAHDKRGAIIVMFALILPVIAGSIGLGVEVALWYKEKRAIQAAADAAAMAGGYAAADGETVSTAASAAASDNGFDTSANPPTVNNPPASGSYTADSNAVEVTLSESFTMMFASLVTDASSLTVRARAVATSATVGEACVLSLNTTGTGVSVSGNGNIAFDGCQVASNSSGSSALNVSGSGDLEIDCYSVVGDVSVTVGLTTDAGCDPQTGASSIDDPYADLETPAYSGCDETGGYTQNSTGTFTFNHDVNFATPYVVCGDLWIKKGTLEMEPGLYIVEGDIKTNATGSLTGDGVTIILKNGGQIDNFNGSSTININAPDPADGAGDWEGILFYQDRDDASVCTGNNCNTMNGNSTSTFEGTIYFPNQEININGGNTGTSTCLQVVAYQVGFSGNSDLDADNTTCSSAGVDPIDIPGPVVLVE